MQSSSPNEQVTFRQLLLQCLAVLVFGLFLFALIGSLLVGAYQIWYSGRIFPGIAVQGINIGGLTRLQAAQYLTENFRFSPSDTITLWYGENRVEVTPAQLGIRLDLATSVNDAYNFGRRGSIGSWFAFQLGSNFASRSIPPTITFDQAGALEILEQIAGQYDQPVREASLALDGIYVTSDMGQVGRQLDLSASLDQISLQIAQMNLEQIILPVVETSPQIMDASPFANAAQKIINRSISLRMPASQADAGREWTIEPEDLAAMLTFETRQSDGQTQLIPQLKQDYLNAYLQEIAQEIEIKTENPRFIFNDQSGELDLLEPGVSGRAIDYGSTSSAIQEALASGQTSIEITVVSQEPEIDDDVSGAGLGITELVHS